MPRITSSIKDDPQALCGWNSSAKSHCEDESPQPKENCSFHVLWSEWKTQYCMQNGFIPSTSGGGEGKKRDLATCCRHWAHTPSLTEKRTCKNKKNSWRETGISRTVDVIRRQISNFYQKPMQGLLFFLLKSLLTFGWGSLTQEFCLLYSTWSIIASLFLEGLYCYNSLLAALHSFKRGEVPHKELKQQGLAVKTTQATRCRGI